MSREPRGDTERFCANCHHHSTFHQLITRDKWKEYAIEPGKIPWFCEYVEDESEEICSCMDFQPMIAGVT